MHDFKPWQCTVLPTPTYETVEPALFMSLTSSSHVVLGWFHSFLIRDTSRGEILHRDPSEGNWQSSLVSSIIRHLLDCTFLLFFSSFILEASSVLKRPDWEYQINKSKKIEREEKEAIPSNKYMKFVEPAYIYWMEKLPTFKLCESNFLGIINCLKASVFQFSNFFNPLVVLFGSLLPLRPFSAIRKIVFPWAV